MENPEQSVNGIFSVHNQPMGNKNVKGVIHPWQPIDKVLKKLLVEEMMP